MPKLRLKRLIPKSIRKSKFRRLRRLRRLLRKKHDGGTIGDDLLQIRHKQTATSSEAEESTTEFIDLRQAYSFDYNASITSEGIEIIIPVEEEDELEKYGPSDLAIENVPKTEVDVESSTSISSIQEQCDEHSTAEDPTLPSPQETESTLPSPQTEEQTEEETNDHAEDHILSSSSSQETESTLPSPQTEEQTEKETNDHAEDHILSSSSQEIESTLPSPQTEEQMEEETNDHAEDHILKSDAPIENEFSTSSSSMQVKCEETSSQMEEETEDYSPKLEESIQSDSSSSIQVQCEEVSSNTEEDCVQEATTEDHSLAQSSSMQVQYDESCTPIEESLPSPETEEDASEPIVDHIPEPDTVIQRSLPTLPDELDNESDDSGSPKCDDEGFFFEDHSSAYSCDESCTLIVGSLTSPKTKEETSKLIVDHIPEPDTVIQRDDKSSSPIEELLASPKTKEEPSEPIVDHIPEPDTVIQRSLPTLYTLHENQVDNPIDLDFDCSESEDSESVECDDEGFHQSFDTSSIWREKKVSFAENLLDEFESYPDLQITFTPSYDIEDDVSVEHVQKGVEISRPKNVSQRQAYDTLCKLLAFAFLLSLFATGPAFGNFLKRIETSRGLFGLSKPRQLEDSKPLKRNVFLNPHHNSMGVWLK